MVKPFALLGLFVLSACNGRAPTTAVDVTTLHKHIHDWDGQVVTVDGWLGKCSGYDCAIFPQTMTAQRYKLLFEDSFNSDEYGRSLSIGWAEEFDAKAKRMQFRRVLLKARINDECYPANCTDRADILQPIDIKEYR